MYVLIKNQYLKKFAKFQNVRHQISKTIAQNTAT